MANARSDDERHGLEKLASVVEVRVSHPFLSVLASFEATHLKRLVFEKVCLNSGLTFFDEMTDKSERHVAILPHGYGNLHAFIS
jgi:hypothetical protein